MKLPQELLHKKSDESAKCEAMHSNIKKQELRQLTNCVHKFMKQAEAIEKKDHKRMSSLEKSQKLAEEILKLSTDFNKIKAALTEHKDLLDIEKRK